VRSRASQKVAEKGENQPILPAAIRKEIAREKQVFNLVLDKVEKTKPRHPPAGRERHTSFSAERAVKSENRPCCSGSSYLRSQRPSGVSKGRRL